MLSRVANSISWMSRYMERTNGMLRLLRTSYISSQDETGSFNWSAVLKLYSDLPVRQTSQIESDTPKVLSHVILDPENVYSVCNNIYRARENARAVQDHITREVWQCLNDYHHLVRNQMINTQILHGDLVSAFDTLIQQGMLYHGTVDITMERGEGFNFLSIGKYLERAILTTDMLMIRLLEARDKQDTTEDSTWRYMLYTLSGYELFIKTYRGNFEPANVVDHVLFNTYFPHSVLYCLTALTNAFEKLKSESLPENYNEVEFFIGRALNNVKYSNIDNADYDTILQFLSKTRTEIFQIANAFNLHYFGNPS